MLIVDCMFSSFFPRGF